MRPSTTAVEKLRKAKLTRKNIADHCGVTRQCVGFWESGRSVPTGKNITLLVELAERHGVTLLLADFAPREGANQERVGANSPELDPDAARIGPPEEVA